MSRPTAQSKLHVPAPVLPYMDAVRRRGDDDPAARPEVTRLSVSTRGPTLRPRGNKNHQPSARSASTHQRIHASGTQRAAVVPRRRRSGNIDSTVIKKDVILFFFFYYK